jgi:hypothetical protein
MHISGAELLRFSCLSTLVWPLCCPKGMLRNKPVILPLGFIINWSLRPFILELLYFNYVLK